jgi:hypothetical protein
MRQRDADLFMVAEDDLRRMVAAVIDQRIVQAAKGRAGIERDILELEGFEQIDDDIRSPLGPGFFHLLRFGHDQLLSRFD